MNSVFFAVQKIEGSRVAKNLGVLQKRRFELIRSMIY